MNGLVLAGVLNLVINCDQLTPEADHWHQSVCMDLAKEYSDVQLTAIKVTDRSVDQTKDLPLVKIGDLLAGRLQVNVRIENGDHLIQRRYLFSVKANQLLWLTKRRMYKGSVIGEQDIIQQQVNVAPFAGVKTINQIKPVDMVLNRTLDKNKIIFGDYIDEKNLIDERQIITVTIVSGGLQIKTQAMALQKATNSGEIIKIRIIETGAVFEALVEGKEKAYVEI